MNEENLSKLVEENIAQGEHSAFVEALGGDLAPDALRKMFSDELKKAALSVWEEYGEPLQSELEMLIATPSRFSEETLRMNYATLPVGEAEPRWLPMELAPKDGKHCLLAVQDGAFVWTVEGSFDGKQWNSVIASGVEPLCWMPKRRIPDEFLPWKNND